MLDTIRGRVYVLGDNVDTDQIIPAHYLTYNPAIPDERRMFGRFALSGVPAGQAGLPDGHVPFVDQSDPDNTRSRFTIIVGGKNFGCGSSREHAPLALAEAGVKAVIAEFYARIFFRNSVNGGYLVPLESTERLVEKVRTGDELEIRISRREVANLTRKEAYALRPLGDVAPIIEAGGVFAYARQAKMV
ncbi:MAG: 3-isopropylmalate dehydratase [Phycisphaerae bacterium]